LDAFGLLEKASTVVTTSNDTASLVGNESSLLRVPLFRQDVSNPLDRFTSLYSAGEVIAHAIFNQHCSLPSLAVARAGDPVQHDAGDNGRRLVQEYGAAAGIERLVCIFSAPPPVIQIVDEDDGKVSSNHSCLQDVEKRLQAVLDDNPMSSSVSHGRFFYSLDIVNGLRTREKNNKHREMLGTGFVFVASLPGLQL
jgi:hypothetical protein